MPELLGFDSLYQQNTKLIKMILQMLPQLAKTQTTIPSSQPQMNEEQSKIKKLP